MTPEIEAKNEFNRLERKAVRLQKLFQQIKTKYESNACSSNEQVLEKYRSTLKGLLRIMAFVEVKYYDKLRSQCPWKPTDSEQWNFCQRWAEFRSEVQNTSKSVQDSLKEYKQAEELQRFEKLAEAKYDKHVAKLSNFRRLLETAKAQLQTFDLDSIDKEIHKSFTDACAWYKQDVVKPFAQIRASSKMCDDLRIALRDDISRVHRDLDELFDYQDLLEDCENLCEALEAARLEFAIAKRSIEQRFSLAGAKTPEERARMIERFEEINRTPPRDGFSFFFDALFKERKDLRSVFDLPET